MSSELLEGILKNRNRAINLKVVFFDVVSYSKRRTQAQAAVIDAFMNCLDEARRETAKTCIDYCEQNKVNFSDDVIFLPCGDGAAVCFPFEGLHDVHLIFAKNVLKQLDKHNVKQSCEKFTENNWCNCHSGFYLTVGVSEGKAILYRDLNGCYNVAGNTLNMAARVMSQADKNQIIFTEEAYDQIIDLVDNPHLDEYFHKYEDIPIKHGIKINLFQYIEKELDYVNCSPPEKIEMLLKANQMMSNMKKFGSMISNMDNPKQMKDVFKSIEDLISNSPLLQDTSIQDKTNFLSKNDE